MTELVDGLDLSHHVKRHGPLDVRKALQWIRQAAQGLAYAHDQNVIHRDIKPGNLLLVEPDQIKILDMGLARLLTDGDDPETTDLTISGTVMGTAAYMAPEQARDTRYADARSDIYSLGCVFFFLLSGQRPFQGSTAIDTIMAHCESPRPPISPYLKPCDAPVADAIESIYLRMVEKSPEERFQSMEVLLDAIDESH